MAEYGMYHENVLSENCELSLLGSNNSMCFVCVSEDVFQQDLSDSRHVLA